VVDAIKDVYTAPHYITALTLGEGVLVVEAHAKPRRVECGEVVTESFTVPVATPPPCWPPTPTPEEP
jgi:hypothetical protein